MLRSGLIDQVERFTELSAYQRIRPADKKSVVLFRLFLRNWDADNVELTIARQEVEGFAKFLEIMRSINRREALIDHDVKALLGAKHALENSGARDAMDAISTTYGRSGALDEHIRIFRDGGPPPAPHELSAIIGDTLSALGR